MRRDYSQECGISAHYILHCTFQQILFEKVSKFMIHFLNEAFIDDNLLVLKRDGTDKDLVVLANENEIPDLNVVRYQIRKRANRSR